MTLVLNGTSTSASAPAVVGDDLDTGVYYPAANQVALATNGTQALLANANQGIQIPNTLGVGATAPSTSGAGITFPASQSASTDANTLDDYEEGTWTPSFASTGTQPSVTPFNSAGTYIKIGRMVQFVAHCQINAVASVGSGQLWVAGLPFTSQTGSGNTGYQACAVGYSAGFGSGQSPIGALVWDNGTTIRMYYLATIGAAAKSDVDVNCLTNGTEIYICGCYRTTA